MHCHIPTTHFKDGTPIKKTDSINYLGGKITANADRSKELNARIGKAASTFSSLKLFWRKTKAPTVWKIQVFNAVILSQLSYGLNSLSISPAMYNRVNAFHVRCLRYILKIDHAYYSRISNEEVLSKLQLVLNKAGGLDILGTNSR